MSEREMLSGRVPAELCDLVRADPRDNQEVIETALWREFGGQRKGAIDRRIEEKKRRISTIESEKNERERELEDEQHALEALQERREAMEDAAERDLRNTIESIAVERSELTGELQITTPADILSETADEHDLSVTQLKERVRDYHATN